MSAAAGKRLVEAAVSESGFLLPYRIEADGIAFCLDRMSTRSASGSFRNQLYLHNRFEVLAGYVDGSFERFSVLADLAEDNDERAESGGFSIVFPAPLAHLQFIFPEHQNHSFALSLGGAADAPQRFHEPGKMLVLFDVSDLIYYIGHHDNLTGIQRVQACVLLGMMAASPRLTRGYLTYNARVGRFEIVDSEYFERLLVDLSLPAANRKIVFDKMDAREGILPRNSEIDAVLSRYPDRRLFIYLLGAAWVHQDYFGHISDLKRIYNAVFCMTVHDLIPVFARETCDQGTAVVFEEFIRKAIFYTDHFVTVSEHTAYDLLRFAAPGGHTRLPVTAIKNAHKFDEFFPPSGRIDPEAVPDEDFVLFVSTIEGRKNHIYIFDVWRSLQERLGRAPLLILVGRPGWRAEAFFEKMLMTDSLNGRIRVLSDVSDALLNELYKRCLFSVYPSSYEGWGLPVGESLSKGRVCVTTLNSSLPEVGRDFAVYVDIGSVHDGFNKISRLITDNDYRRRHEAELRQHFRPRSWTDVAQEITEFLLQLPVKAKGSFPVITPGREYKMSRLPQRQFNSLGSQMVAEVEGARRAELTGYINDDDELIFAQSMRAGQSWCAPEGWGTWSKYPTARKMFFVRLNAGAHQVTLYEKMCVVAPLVGHVLTITIGKQPPVSHLITDAHFSLRLVADVPPGFSGLFRIDITYSFDESPPEMFNELRKIDGRVLGLGFESTLVVEDQDIASRLAVLEQFVFGGPIEKSFLAPRSAPKRSWSRHRGRGSYGLASERERGDELAPNKIEIIRKPMAVGRRVRLSISEELVGEAAILGSGWHQLEADGVWSSEKTGRLFLRLNKSPRDGVVIFLTMRTLAGAEGKVEVGFFSAGEQLHRIAFTDDGWTTAAVTVPARLIDDSHSFELEIVADRTVRPSSLGESRDDRELGVRVTQIDIRPTSVMTLGGAYRVGSESSVQDAFCEGWYSVEDEGIWSGEEACLQAEVRADRLVNEVALEASVRVFGTAFTGPAQVSIRVGDVEVESWRFDSDAIERRRVVLPLEELDDKRFVNFTLHRINCVSPSQAAMDQDTRKLGVWFGELAVQEIEAKPAELTVS